MARRLLTALAMVHSATAALEFVDVLVKVDEFRLHVDKLAAGDDGVDACQTADAVLVACVNAGYSDLTDPDGSHCACCLDNTPMADVYSSCRSWAEDQGIRRISLIVDQVSSACADVTVCTDSDPIATVSPTTISLPPVCKSFTSIYSSCVTPPAIYTSALSDVAECFCPEEDGTNNMSFQSYASSCASWARSSYPADYSVITRLATFCDVNLATANTESLIFSTIGTRTGPGFGPISSTSSTTTSPTPDADTASESSATSTSSTGSAPQGVTPPGIMLWLVELATLLLSPFLMI